MTIVRVQDRTYDFDASPFLGDLRLLKKKFGFGWATVQARIAAVPDGTLWGEVFEDEEAGPALVARIWMMMLRAGNRDVTVEDLWNLPADEISFHANPDPATDDPGDEPDPTSAQTASDLGDAADKAAKAPPTRASSKTPRRPSSRASR